MGGGVLDTSHGPRIMSFGCTLCAEIWGAYGLIYVYAPMEHLLPWALEVEHLRIFPVGGALRGCCASVPALVAGMYRLVVV